MNHRIAHRNLVSSTPAVTVFDAARHILDCRGVMTAMKLERLCFYLM